MSHEALLLLALQGVLALLTTVSLRWTANMRQEVRELRTEIRAAADGGLKTTERVNGIEDRIEVMDSRLERVGSVASDNRLDIGNLKSRVDVCQHCPQPGSVHGARAGWGQ
jgi:hypothetical protein